MVIFPVFRASLKTKMNMTADGNFRFPWLEIRRFVLEFFYFFWDKIRSTEDSKLSSGVRVNSVPVL